jgi:3'-5' exoribonuclease
MNETTIESPPRRFLKEFGENESVNQVFLLGDKQLRQNRNGNLYLQMRLSDRTGAVTGMLWNASNDTAADVHNGDYVHVDGTTQNFNGSIQVIAKKIKPAEQGAYSEEDFVHISAAELARRRSRLSELLHNCENPHLRKLAECFLTDDAFLDRLGRAPAAVKNHHAYHGGLLEHVVQLMELARTVGELYPQIDTDLLVFGAFLHDLGKIEELGYERDLAYTDEGQLIGHLVMGVRIVEDKIEQVTQMGDEPFPEELALRLKHMIVSHHGKLEFGSPKVPMTLEAIALHYIDDLDAKIHCMHQEIVEDLNIDSHWTPFNPGLGRKLFKGSRP